MIYRTVTIEPELSNNVIEIEPTVSNNIIETPVEIITKIQHYVSDYDDYEGEYSIVPDWEAQTLQTKNKIMHADVTVEGIYINSAENLAGGNTVYIGGIIDA